jgi:non-ribosomal peptide synthetase component F
MAAHFKEAYFSQETVEKASHFCSNLETDLNGLYSTAWCYTKSLYTCSSDVTSSLVQSSGQEDVLQVSRVSATFIKHMTIKEAYSSIRIVEAGIVNNDGLASYLDHGTDFHDGGTSFWIGDIQSLQMEVSHVPVEKLPQLFVVINGTQMKIGYTPHLVTAYSPEAFLDTFVKVVTQFVGQPYDTCLLDLDVLGPYNRTTLDRWMSSNLVLIERCIHNYVDEHAMETPEKEAVVSTEGPNFTYARLSRLSDKLAIHLASLGIKKGDIVPVLFEKSSIAVLAVISIMKAGGAYVGFAAESPINFLRECAAIADVPLIITSRQNESLLRRLGRCPLVIDSEFLASLETCLDHNGFESPAQPSDLAYLVFTSGSTGVPKVRTHSRIPISSFPQAKEMALDGF